MPVVVVVIAGSVPEKPPPLHDTSQVATARRVNVPPGLSAEVFVWVCPQVGEADRG